MTSLRRWKRVKIDMRVRLRRTEANDSGVVVRTYELSEGGMSLYIPDPIDMNASVQLDFTLPGRTRTLKLSAIVRNRRGFRHGIEFVDVSLDDQNEIARYLTSVVDVIEI